MGTVGEDLPKFCVYKMSCHSALCFTPFNIIQHNRMSLYKVVCEVTRCGEPRFYMDLCY